MLRAAGKEKHIRFLAQILVCPSLIQHYVRTGGDMICITLWGTSARGQSAAFNLRYESLGYYILPGVNNLGQILLRHFELVCLIGAVTALCRNVQWLCNFMLYKPSPDARQIVLIDELHVGL